MPKSIATHALTGFAAFALTMNRLMVKRARRTFRAMSVLIVLLVLASLAKADHIQQFDASGTFEDGSSLSGTVTINTTKGVATAVDLSVGAPGSLQFDSGSGTIGLFSTPYGADFPTVFAIEITTTAGWLVTPRLFLLIPTDTLRNYKGGNMIGLSSDPFPWTSWEVDDPLSSTEVFLQSGALIPRKHNPK